MKCLLSICIVLLFSLNSLQGQSVKQEKMEALGFIVGHWVGESAQFNNDGSIKNQVPAYEQIEYKLDQHIITLDLFSETLLIHTIIYYDEEVEHYWYCPFYKGGSGKYKGEVIDGKFMVYFNESKRLTFHRTEEDYFQEFGEKLVAGNWTKYFEDTFKPME